MTEFRKWTLAKHPSGVPSADCFALESFTPDAPSDGEVLIRTHYFSLDPGMRGRLSGDSYAAGLKIGDTIESAGIGEIIASKSERFAVGDMVMGGLGWTEALLHADRGLQKLDPALFNDQVGMTGDHWRFGCARPDRMVWLARPRPTAKRRDAADIICRWPGGRKLRANRQNIGTDGYRHCRWRRKMRLFERFGL
jgi:hypothetical protein